VVSLGAIPMAAIFVGNAVTWRGGAFAAVAIIGALPAGCALAAIRVLSLRGLRGTVGRQLAGLITLRRLLNRLLSIPWPRAPSPRCCPPDPAGGVRNAGT
jgi:hypothetical protein